MWGNLGPGKELHVDRTPQPIEILLRLTLDPRTHQVTGLQLEDPAAATRTSSPEIPVKPSPRHALEKMNPGQLLKLCHVRRTDELLMQFTTDRIREVCLAGLSRRTSIKNLGGWVRKALTAGWDVDQVKPTRPAEVRGSLLQAITPPQETPR